MTDLEGAVELVARAVQTRMAGAARDAARNNLGVKLTNEMIRDAAEHATVSGLPVLALSTILDALASITRERDAMREGLKDALPWAEMGFYLWDACSFTAGDRRTEPEERTITWQWQQVLPDDHDWSAMRSDVEKFLADLTEDTETSPWVLDLPVIRAAALVNGEGG